MNKYPRTYHLPYSQSKTSDDKISNDINNLIDSEIIITEKLDGSNSCITKNSAYGRSHAIPTENAWDVKLRELQSNIGSYLDDDVYLFGENMEGIHSIEYTNLKSYFYLFGVRDNNIWITWDQVEEYAYLLDLKTVPVLFKGVVGTEKELKEIIDSLVTNPSELGGEREGIVIRTTGLFHNDDFKGNVVKWVRKDHVQTDEHWSRNWRKAKINDKTII